MSSSRSRRARMPAWIARVERLHAAAEHLRRAGHVLDARHREALLLEERRGAARRDELEAELGEPARERRRCRACRRREISAAARAHSSRSTTSGSSRCSTAWMRSIERLARLDRHALLREHRPGVEPLVDEVDGDARRLDAGRERVLDRVRAGERRQQRRVDVDDRARGSGRGTASSAGACSRRARRARRRAPRASVAITRSRSSRSAWQSRLKRRGRDRRPRARAAARRRPCGSTRPRATGSPASISACRFVPLPQTSTPIIAIRPITSSPGRGSRDDRAPADAEVEDAAQLVLVDVPREPRRTPAAAPRRPSRARRCRPSGSDALEVAEDAAAGDVRERLRAAAQRARDVEVEARRREQVGRRRSPRRSSTRRTSVNPFACTPADGEADHGVAGRDRRAVDQVGALDDADAGAGEVELALAVDAGQLGRLAADERDAGRAADLGGALDELGDLLEVGSRSRRRSRAASAASAPQVSDVVDAVRGEVGAAVAQPAALRARASASCRRRRSTRRAGGRRRAGAGPRTRRSPCAPVDSTAARRRSTTDSAVASETPAAA